MKLKLLKQPKIVRKIKGKNLLGEKKELFVFPIRMDTVYFILKTSQASLPIDVLYPDLIEYFEKKGFSRTVHTQSDSCSWKNSYGLTIFYGKTHRTHTYKSIKFQLTGEFLIYKNAEKIARCIVKDIKSIGATRGLLVDVSVSRADPSFLVIANHPHDIAPKPSDKIFIANGMEYTPHFYKENPSELSGFDYRNSRFCLRVYDKASQIFNECNNLSGEYKKYYLPLIKLARSMNKKIFRVELETHNEDHLFHYGKSFFGKNWEQEHYAGMCALLNKFIQYHSFRQVPKGQKDESDKRNRGRWKKDEIIDNLFFSEKEEGDVSELEPPPLRKFSYKSHKPIRITTIDMFIKKAAKDLAKIDPNLSTCDLNLIKSKIILAYHNIKYDIEESYKSRILNQSAFRMAFVESPEDIALIEREQKVLFAKLNVKSDFSFEVRFRHILEDARKELSAKDFASSG